MVSSKQDILPLRFVRLEEKAISECISCGTCVDVCPCIPMSKLQDMNPEEISSKFGLIATIVYLNFEEFNCGQKCCHKIDILSSDGV